MSFTVLIPARLASTRLPDKPLADLGGVPMVVRVAQQALQSGALRAVVAADSVQIMDACKAWNIDSVLTRTDHPSGSDRLAEACELLGLRGDEIVVNVQGDEPLIDPSLIDAVANLLTERPSASMSTAAHVIDNLDDFRNPNVVKVVLDAQGLALYFSRAPIAWWRDGFGGGINALPQALKPLRHVGIYAYRAGFLREFPRLPQAPVEVVEALEQLRAMWHGYRIAVHVSEHVPGPGVDTPQDLERVRKLF
ncbi:MAG: 3-deoxy-manno-octulosonate cytidylyltransferase [Bdellovibrionales bacterium]|nr:3-deoxy-manno-octulosonate cytidylyltransferase [Ramlibacter sp.]